MYGARKGFVENNGKSEKLKIINTTANYFF